MHALLLYPLYISLIYLTTMLTCFLLYHTLPNPPNILGFIARCMSAYISMVVCAAYGTTASAILKCFGLQFKYGQWTAGKSFKWICRYSIGIKFDILGDGDHKLNAKRPYVIICNHQTELDVLLLGCIWPQHCSVTAKKSLRNIPFLGWFMTLSGAVFIDRGDRNSAMKAFEGAAKTMQDLGQSVLIFPEGTRSYSTEPMLLPFKKGAFHLAIQAGADVLPVVAENYSKVLNLKAKRFNAGTIRVKVLDPIPTKNMSPADVTELMNESRTKMLDALNEMAADKGSKAVKAHAS